LDHRAPSIAFRCRLRNELGDGVEMFNSKGWVDDPRSYHRDPPALKRPRLTKKSAAGLAYEHLIVKSGYEPHPDEPGRERRLDYEANREAHAWVMRHDDGPRPWLICINGYRTGSPRIDFGAFNAKHLHHDRRHRGWCLGSFARRLLHVAPGVFRRRPGLRDCRCP
jgi:hypothetical protein